MKKILFLLLIFLPSGLSANHYSGEIESGIQLNHPTASSVGAGLARFRLGAELNTPHTNIRLHLRACTASGKSFFGSASLMAPANAISVDPKELTLDQAYFSMEKGGAFFCIGLMDPAQFTPEHTGFFSLTLTGNESTQFLSTHFLWLLANNGLDQMVYQSLPAVFFGFRITRNIRFRTGMTFGLASQHLFLRNSIPAELEFISSWLHVSLNAGFGDAHSSYTHKISPSYGFIVEKSLVRHLFVFVKGSIVEKDLKTYRTPDQQFSGDYLVAKEFSTFDKHISTGICFQKEGRSAGIGYSRASEFGRSEAEKVIEIYVRQKVLDTFDLTPDFQYIFHPNGNKNVSCMWIAGLRLYYPFDLI
ncbi:MAG: carbohydrate porin [bacterium]|nr:carbohydrate porin [bacterium]